MNSKVARVYFLIVFVLIWLLSMGACSTTETTPLPPVPPSYSQVPHPEGMNLADLMALFTDKSAPVLGEFVKTCDKDFNRLNQLTQSKSELTDGVQELVSQDPVMYHWCFYSKLLVLEKLLKTDVYIDKKQKDVLNTFQFLVPVARSFLVLFHDSRYLRWAVYKYENLSSWLFYRKLELTPEGTVELIQPTNPFGLWRDSNSDTSVIEKYNLSQQKADSNTSSASAPLSPDQQKAKLAQLDADLTALTSPLGPEDAQQVRSLKAGPGPTSGATPVPSSVSTPVSTPMPQSTASPRSAAAPRSAAVPPSAVALRPTAASRSTVTPQSTPKPPAASPPPIASAGGAGHKVAPAASAAKGAPPEKSAKGTKSAPAAKGVKSKPSVISTTAPKSTNAQTLIAK